MVSSLLCASIIASAVPARKGRIVKTQPDGTEIVVTVHGNERSHYVLSEDGLLLLPDESGTYCYAIENSDKAIVPSTVAARSVADRSIAERTMAEQLRPAAQTMISRHLQAQPARLAPRHNVASTESRANSSVATPAKFPNSNFPTVGTVRSLVILVNYTDVKFNLSDPHDYYDRQWNEQGFKDDKATGSVRDYFVDQSLGKFRPQFDVYGPVELPHNQAYYGRNVGGVDEKAHEMIIHAFQLLDDEVDFSVYDTDKDGQIDNVYVIYAGEPESSTGGANSVWPHSFTIDDTGMQYKQIYDGVKVNPYACSAEMGDRKTRAGIGTPCHEFSHVLGLPDLYDTVDAYNPETPSYWSVLDQACYNNNERTPLGYGIFERYALGWVTPQIIDGPENVTLEHVATGDGAIIPTLSPDEYFILENRQMKGWDAYAPATGMLVWHIHYAPRVWTYNTVNNDRAHQRVDLIEADCSVGTVYKPDPQGDTFPGSTKKTSLTGSTQPSLLTWELLDLDLPITDIAEKNGLITFKVSGGKPEASIEDISGDSAALPQLSLNGLSLTVGECEGSVIVADIAGRIVASSAHGSLSCTLPSAGIYIVRCGDKAVRIAARN